MFRQKINEIFGIKKESEAFSFHKNKKNQFEKFICIEGSSMEIEYLELIRSLILINKPKFLLETGSYMGYSTSAIYSAILENDFGELTSIEINSNFHRKTQENVKKFGLKSNLPINFLLGNSIEIIPKLKNKFSFVCLDSGSNALQLETRIKELKILLTNNMLKNDCIIFIHDTSRYDNRFKNFNKNIIEICKIYKLKVINFDLCRGGTIIKYSNFKKIL